ncbi:hypothetical protein GOACH_04_00920 [Gordonia aichiensis NBRC 108223]|uniref:Uncharacterized protein n=1 Tax=Gordonia aichiensis NBRC 108223 TaxID=1220583 RepID=L7KGT0_9ACTN|nr:hypothetical protein GOACH_04_00920 [Gordonia aichiensis NBRC 108223]
MLTQQRSTLAFGHTTPHTELDAVVERIGSAFELYRAVAADDRSLPLSRTTNEELIGVLTAAARP